jgi:hypothetical protein
MLSVGWPAFRCSSGRVARILECAADTAASTDLNWFAEGAAES